MQQAAGRRILLTRGEQSLELLSDVLTGLDSGEFDVALAFARFRISSAMTNSKAREVFVVPQQDGVAEILSVYGMDFPFAAVRGTRLR